MRIPVKMAAVVKRPLSEMMASALVPAKRPRHEVVEYGQRRGDGSLVAAVSEHASCKDNNSF